MSPGESCAIVFVKYPLPGTVKTRLAATLGHRQTTILYKKFVEDTLSALTKTGEDLFVCFSPARVRSACITWLGKEYRYKAQYGKDLGERMRNAFIDLFRRGYKKVVIVGSDTPDLPASLLTRAFRALDKNGVVIGPSLDGGYYLIGFTLDRFQKTIFDNVSWSSDTVLSSTVATLSRLNMIPCLLPRRRDIDTWPDLKSFYRANRANRELRSIAYINKCPLIREGLEEKNRRNYV
jgi:rSAM/selenodomain-associated transferase 1